MDKYYYAEVEVTVEYTFVVYYYNVFFNSKKMRDKWMQEFKGQSTLKRITKTGEAHFNHLGILVPTK